MGKRKASLEKLTVDHKKPYSRGGTDDIDNLQCLCSKCNIKKANIYPYHYQGSKL